MQALHSLKINHKQLQAPRSDVLSHVPSHGAEGLPESPGPGEWWTSLCWQIHRLLYSLLAFCSLHKARKLLCDMEDFVQAYKAMIRVPSGLGMRSCAPYQLQAAHSYSSWDRLFLSCCDQLCPDVLSLETPS